MCLQGTVKTCQTLIDAVPALQEIKIQIRVDEREWRARELRRQDLVEFLFVEFITIKARMTSVSFAMDGT